MIRKGTISLLFIFLIFFLSCCTRKQEDMKKVIFLHHSTGWNVWLGKTHRYVYKLTGSSDVRSAVKSYAKDAGLKVEISERFFPKDTPYGWNNYPYDYYNIWVKNRGNELYMEEPTLEILSKQYNMIIFKHCFPVSNILPDSGEPDINSDKKTIENYKLQYDALKAVMHEFSQVKFVLWTPAVNVRGKISREEAERTKDFYNWVINTWDEKGDNIYLWDFYKYETEGELYLQDKYAVNINDSHPNKEFSAKVAKLLGKFIVDVLGNKVE